MEAEGARLGIAFALVVVAGLCAPVGASVVVFMKRSHTGLLAASIALAAGVMVFVSLTEVRQLSRCCCCFLCCPISYCAGCHSQQL